MITQQINVYFDAGALYQSKRSSARKKHAVSALYRGCVLFYCLFYETHRMTEICLVPLPCPYRFSVRVFFELLRERKCLKNTLLSAVFKRFTNKKDNCDKKAVSFCKLEFSST